MRYQYMAVLIESHPSAMVSRLDALSTQGWEPTFAYEGWAYLRRLLPETTPQWEYKSERPDILIDFAGYLAYEAKQGWEFIDLFQHAFLFRRRPPVAPEPTP